MQIKSNAKYEFGGYYLFFFVAAVTVRMLNFSESLNFSTDQAFFSLRALELWQNKEATLVGPTASIAYEGRFLIQSSAIYYLTMVFQLLGNFNPIHASVAFSIFASLMSGFLFKGVSEFFNKSTAVLVTGLYAVYPYYVSYTKFLWNPNYQLALLPLYLYCLGKWKKSRATSWLFVFGAIGGFLLLFHYQFAVVLLFMLLWMTVHTKSVSTVLVWISGCVLGFSPMILFELNSSFYISKTTWLLLSHWSQLSSNGPTQFPAHYFLSISFFIVCMGIGVLQKKFPKQITYQWSKYFVVGLFIVSSFYFGRKPVSAFGMAEDWSFLDELAVHEVVVSQNLDSFAVVNTLYDTKATVQYYLLNRDATKGWTTDYRNNEFLFVIGKKEVNSFYADQAYELSNFFPAEFKNEWKISETTSLYLFERK